jgi:hypothetical protein
MSRPRHSIRFRIGLLAGAVVVLFLSPAPGRVAVRAASGRAAPDAPVIKSAAVVTPPVNPIPSAGDLWMNTWADDNRLYTGWGDGQGPGDQPPYTDCGVGVLKGNVPYFVVETDPICYVRSKNVPDGTTARNDKPSSLLYYKGRLYFAGHSPLGNADFGYIAYSKDKGATWTEVPGSPWTKAGRSPLRCLFFVNMGKGQKLRQDAYAYAFGIGTEWAWLPARVYLARVRWDSLADYGAYEYFAGLNGSSPSWSQDQADARPVDGLKSHQMSSAMYHEGIERFLFLTIDQLYEAPQPWGPWSAIAAVLGGGSDPEWKGGYMPGIIAKGAGADFFYFTLAGQSDVIRYSLHVGKISFQLNSEITARASADPATGKAPLKVRFKGGGQASGAAIASYRWYFGDGAVSTARNPVHTYSSATYGSYRAMLTVTDSQGRRGFDIVEITVPFCAATLEKPETTGALQPGLKAEYYDLPAAGGEKVPDFSTLTPYKTDVVPDLNYRSLGLPRLGGTEFATSGRKDKVAARFSGFIVAPADAIYTFYLISDDASELRIGGRTIIVNDGEHRCQMRERAGQVGLKAGRHSIEVGYTEITLLNGLRLGWERPESERAFVPASALRH